MLKLNIKNRENDILDEIIRTTQLQVKSRVYYPGFDEWLHNRFMPSYLIGGRDVISVRDKRYGTLLGFALMKIGEENKICNLSPLVDGVGMTQALLDSALIYFSKDFSIDVPLIGDTIKLHSKLKQLGFEVVSSGFSNDRTAQVTYVKDRNIGWI